MEPDRRPVFESCSAMRPRQVASVTWPMKWGGDHRPHFPELGGLTPGRPRPVGGPAPALGGLRPKFLKQQSVEGALWRIWPQKQALHLSPSRPGTATGWKRPHPRLSGSTGKQGPVPPPVRMCLVAGKGWICKHRSLGAPWAMRPSVWHFQAEPSTCSGCRWGRGWCLQVTSRPLGRA